MKKQAELTLFISFLPQLIARAKPKDATITAEAPSPSHTSYLSFPEKLFKSAHRLLNVLVDIDARHPFTPVGKERKGE